MPERSEGSIHSNERSVIKENDTGEFIKKRMFFYVMDSLPGYLQATHGRTYIDKYPRTIIDIDELRNGVLLEFGPGAGNDLLWLCQHGMAPDRLFSLEADRAAYAIQSFVLREQLRGFALFHLPFDLSDSRFPPEGGFDFVYANNVLHCLGNAAGIYAATTRAFGHLKTGGVFFGRTLSDKIDSERLAATITRQEEITRKILAEPIPEVSHFETCEMSFQVGSDTINSQTAIHRLDTADGKKILSEYIERAERKKQERISGTREAFVLSTVNALKDGRLMGVKPEKLEQIARSVGFSETHVEVRKHPWKPTEDFYFRFEKSD